MMYIHEREGWPEFFWDETSLEKTLGAVRHRQGQLAGKMEYLGLDLKSESLLRTLTEDVLKTSEIEGERLDREQVRSSLARRLGLESGGLQPTDRGVDGIVAMTLDATRNFKEPLTAERLFTWHKDLFPAGRNTLGEILVGRWRDDRKGPMQVVSGPIGREKVHYQAPDAKRLDAEVAAFLRWFEGSSQNDLVLKAGIAHLWFVTLHPFEDGNGRVARAIADLALTRSDDMPRRFYSMSAQIREERKLYYGILERTQKGGLDVTPWLDWFLGCLGRAIEGAETTLGSVLRKSRFWKSVSGVSIGERQRRVLNRLLDGFEGKLTNAKWVKLAKCSPDTALRDINDLMEKGVLKRDPAAGGRSTNYLLVEEKL